MTPLLKVYGNVYPASARLYNALAGALTQAITDGGDDIPLLCRDGDMIRISFEGFYFPVDEALEALRQNLSADSRGKLDVLDMENWRMTRHEFVNGVIISHATTSLNNVLDYSGF